MPQALSALFLKTTRKMRATKRCCQTLLTIYSFYHTQSSDASSVISDNTYWQMDGASHILMRWNRSTTILFNPHMPSQIFMIHSFCETKICYLMMYGLLWRAIRVCVSVFLKWTYILPGTAQAENKVLIVKSEKEKFQTSLTNIPLKGVLHIKQFTLFNQLLHNYNVL